MAKKKSLARRAAGGLAKYSWLGVKALGGGLLKGAKWTAGKISKTAASASRNRQPASFEPLKEVDAYDGSLGAFQDFVYSQKSTIGLILGARGSGKSALGMRLLENAAARGRKVAAIGFKESVLPSWIQIVSPDGLNSVPNGSFLLVDEGGIAFGSRSSMSSANKLLSELLFVSRHKDLSVLFISQNSANLEVNALRQADYLLLKKPSLLQKDFERKKINEIYANALKGFEKHPEKSSFYAYSDEFTGFASSSLPSFWSEKTGKSFENKKLG